MSTKLSLHSIEVALESAQSCIGGETPEVMSDDEAREWTLDAIRGALLVHLPAIRALLEARMEGLNG